MAIRLGPAGIPLACKGKTTVEGVRCVSLLGLSALEIEFVRSVYLDDEGARAVGKVARELDVALTCHAPYYVNLAAKDTLVLEKSRKFVSDTLRIADACGASIAVVHAGFYMGREASLTFELIKKEVISFDYKAKVGIETMGRQKQFGTLDEVERMTAECENVVPVVDFAHVHARTNGGIRSKEDFSAILDRFERIGVRPLHCHMTGIYHEKGNEKFHMTLSSHEPDFRLLAAVLRENGYDVTIISESPVLEEDAILFRGWVEK